MINIDFSKTELFKQVLENYYDVFSKTLDTAEYVPKKYNDKILKILFKDMKRKFKEVNKKCKRELNQQLKAESKLRRKLFKQKIKLFFISVWKAIKKFFIK